MKTPYTLVFGREPLEAIPRNVQKDEVLNAFQVLGYYTSKYNGDYKKAIPEFKSYLEDYVYEKVLSEMSEKDRVFACAIAKTKNGKAKDIKTLLEIRDNEYSVYRDRLVKRGIIDGSVHGYVRFTLPLFDEYLLQNQL